MKYINANIAFKKYGMARGILRALYESGVVDRQKREVGLYTMYVYSEEDIQNFINNNVERK